MAELETVIWIENSMTVSLGYHKWTAKTESDASVMADRIAKAIRQAGYPVRIARFTTPKE